MPVDTVVIFKGLSISYSVAKYIGIVEDRLTAKLDQLAGSEFEAGMRALQQASESENEQAFLLREARSRFNKAISFEQEIRLALAYLGLALCHWHLGDKTNAKSTLKEIVMPTPSSLWWLQDSADILNKMFDDRLHDEHPPEFIQVLGKVLLPIGRLILFPPRLVTQQAAKLLKRKFNETEEQQRKLAELQWNVKQTLQQL